MAFIFLNLSKIVIILLILIYTWIKEHLKQNRHLCLSNYDLSFHMNFKKSGIAHATETVRYQFCGYQEENDNLVRQHYRTWSARTDL